MNKLMFIIIFLFVSLTNVVPATAQPPSFYGYGDDIRDYYDEMREYGRRPTASPEEVRDYMEKRQKEKTIKTYFWILVGILFLYLLFTGQL